MSAPSGDVVVDRLEQLATHAPTSGVGPDDLWSRGRRRQRGRAASLLVGLVAAGIVATTVTPPILARVDQPVASSSDRLVLPDVVREPGAWEPAFAATPRRLSAVGVAQRGGVFSSSAQFWGVSAATGESRWLDLPGGVPAAGADARLSADGRRLAYWVTGDVPQEPLSMGATEDDTPVVGLAVMDLETGEVKRWDLPSDHGLSVEGLVWAGDALWWQAGPVVPLEGGGMSAELRTRIWQVETDVRTEVTDARSDVYLFESGGAPDGFVTVQGTSSLERVTGDGEPESLRVDLPPGAPSAAALVDPSVSPDGGLVVAMMVPDGQVVLDDPAGWQLVAGRVDDDAVDLRRVRPVLASAVVGWRSPTELMVVDSGNVAENSGIRVAHALSVVDLRELDRPRAETSIWVEARAIPEFAADVWSADVVEAPAAPFAPDPRVVGLVLLVGALVAWRGVVTVRRRRGHP